MKCLIIYVSVHHGNTDKIARAMANALDADLLQVKHVDAGIVEQYDLIGFGSGIYFGRHHKSLLDIVCGLPLLRHKKAFIFSTSGLRRLRFIHDFDKRLKQALERKGLEIVGEFSCRGFDRFGAAMILGGINRGRPHSKDLRRAQDFARALITSQCSGHHTCS